MKLYLRDRNEAVIIALQSAFSQFLTGGDEIVIQQGDIMQDPLPEAIVSPANSFGYMDGGIDFVYVKEFGWEVESNVQAEIHKLPFKELLIGQAIVAPTGNDKVPWIISAPTMRMPGPTTDWAVYLAMRAAMDVALKKGYKTVACPGLGTATGRVRPDIAATAMNAGYVAGYVMQKEKL